MSRNPNLPVYSHLPYRFFAFSFFLFSLSCILFQVVCPQCLYARTPHSVQVDGEISDWQADELIIDDGIGDSWWQQDNEIDRIYMTWDSLYLYIGARYSVRNNAFLIVLDLGEHRGVSDLKQLDWYPRDLVFQGFSAEAIIALWNADLSSGGVRKINRDGKTFAIQYFAVNNATPGAFGILEVRLPWANLYERSTPRIPPGTKIKVLSAICGGDYSPPGDIAPDQEPGYIRLSKFFSLLVDANNDSLPDQNISPGISGSILTTPFVPLSASILEISPRIFDPSKENLKIRYTTTVESRVTLSIFSLSGEKVRELLVDENLPAGEKIITWDGKNKYGIDLPFGAYIVNLVVDNVVCDRKPLVIVR